MIHCFFAIKDSTISLAHIIYIIYTHLVSSRKWVVGWISEGLVLSVLQTIRVRWDCSKTTVHCYWKTNQPNTNRHKNDSKDIAKTIRKRKEGTKDSKWPQTSRKKTSVSYRITTNLWRKRQADHREIKSFKTQTLNKPKYTATSLLLLLTFSLVSRV